MKPTYEQLEAHLNKCQSQRARIETEREQLRDQVKDQRITILQLRAILQGLGNAREPKP